MADLEDATERGLFRNRPFLAIWSAQILSQTAANAITIALIILVGEITRSNTSSSILILLAIAPAVVFGVLAGVIVDRADRKRVLIVTNVLRALAVVPLLFVRESVVAAYIANFAVAAITVFFVPAEAAVLPSIVRRRDLLVANSLFTFTFNAAFLIGFILLAPITIAVAGFDALFGIVVLMFAAAAILCVTLPATPPPPAHLGADVAGLALKETRRAMGEALSYLRGAPLLLWALIYIALTYTLVAIAGALAPGFVREVLGLESRQVVIIVGPAGLGVVAGLGLLNAVGTRVSRPHAIGIGLVVTVFALVGLAAARPATDILRPHAGAGLGESLGFFIALVAAVTFVFGVAYAFITVPAMTLLQEELHDHIRGRVFGVLNMLVSVFSFLPLVIVGPIADIWGVAPVFLASAVIVAITWLAGRPERHRARPDPATPHSVEIPQPGAS